MQKATCPHKYIIFKSNKIYYQLSQLRNMKEKRKVIFLLLMFLCVLPISIMAQQKTVKGRVIEKETGEPLPGVSVSVLKSTRGVSTDIDGTYEIKVAPTDKLVFNFLGMQPQTIEVGNKTNIEVVLLPLANELDEVTIVAFGKQKKESITSSITTVTPKDLKVP